ncbi:Os02g0324200 [Oryza sativa Japonica Group]|nr:Os02g0324200 [Oryza sativa Japonica Group]|eukprot:NP_001046695.1 Os02g0324200 [Oryza sativa Japonica Group]
MRWGGRLEEGGDNLDDGCPHQRWSGSRVATGQYSNIGTKDYTSKLSVC